MSARISVAMASYNGALYIREQLASILDQLSQADEVVIVDDASRDTTVQIIQGFGDARVRLYQSVSNRGLVTTFTEAVSRCTGNIIFLADQDDIWLPGKVDAVLEAFARDPAVNIVSTDALVVDGNGSLLLESYYDDRGGFTDSVVRNLIKSRFHGCLMAFRTELKPVVLPLVNYHDVWIGLCNKVLGGKAAFLRQPYISYRRHGKNESAPLPWNRQVTKRIGLLAHLLHRILGRYRAGRKSLAAAQR